MGDELLRGRNVLVTGPSRSGTTLTCELLNRIPDTVALDEPLNARSLLGYDVPEPGAPPPPRPAAPRRLASRLYHLGTTSGSGPGSKPPDLTEACDNIERFLAEARQSILGRGVALSRHVGGQVLGKKVADEYGDEGLRVRLAEMGEISVDKELSAGFLLAIKQTSGFIAMLEALVQRFEVYSLVRNPLAVITSWQSLPFHPQDGHVRLGEGIDHDLRDRLAGMPDRIDRQFEILAWYFARISDWVPPANVIRYEDLVASQGRALSAISPKVGDIAVGLENRNRGRPDRGSGPTRDLGERLLDTDGPWWRFYTPDSVAALLAAE